jgi:hypothetical protein
VTCRNASPSLSSLTYNSKNQTSSITPAGGSALGLSYRGSGQADRASAGSDSFTVSRLGTASRSNASGSSYFVRDQSGGLLAVQENGGQYFYLFDGLGSVAGLTDGAGNLVSGFTYQYDPYGKQTNTTPAGYPFNPYTYVGGLDYYTDSSTGLYHAGEP